MITGGNLAKLPGGLGGQTKVVETCTLAHGQGWITLLAPAFALDSAPLAAPLRSEVDRPLAKPFCLDEGARKTLEAIFRQQGLFAVEGEGLSWVTCRKGPGDFTIGIANNRWCEATFRLVSRCGAMASVRELEVDTAERSAIGLLPEGVDGSGLGRNGPDTIAGGDVRIFSVRVAEVNVAELAHRAPPIRPTGRLLTLRPARPIKEAILARPTFFEHFDGVVVDWRQIHDREAAVLSSESAWIRRQGLRVVVDLSSGLNLYPDFRLVENVADDFAASMTRIESLLAKMALLPSRDLVLSLHRTPENNFTAEQTLTGFASALSRLADRAAEHGITLHVRAGRGKSALGTYELAQLIERTEKANLKVAPALSHWLADQASGVESAVPAGAAVDLWLAAAPRYDIAGQFYDPHAPLATLTETDRARARGWPGFAPGRTLVFDACLGDLDAEYRDAKLAAEWTHPAR